MKLPPFPGALITDLVERPFISKTGKAGCQRVRAIVLTPEQQQWLSTHFATTDNPTLIRISGMSHSTLHRWANLLHLTKSPQGMRKIRRKQARDARRTCERNGYYDSIRGRQPSEACREATRRRWQEVRDGTKQHPFKIMKQRNPRRYRQMTERKRQERREAIRREQQRTLYGLPRQTHLRIVMTPYTRRQVSHRYNALKRGYIVSTDTTEGTGTDRYRIYYDANTPRSSRFESNLIADGFTLHPWDG